MPVTLQVSPATSNPMNLMLYRTIPTVSLMMALAPYKIKYKIDHGKGLLQRGISQAREVLNN